MTYEDDTFLTRPIDRRTFIRRGIAFVGAGAMTPPAYLRAVFDEDSRPLTAESAVNFAAEQRHVLVVLQLAGGNDGLNTVAPVGDGAYFDARPGIALNPEAALPLGDGLALNPVMTGMKTLYDRGQLGVVLGVGYPQPNRSHFRSMDIWHTASLDKHTDTGWIGRLLDATKHERQSLWRAANIGQSQALSFRSEDGFVPSIGAVPAYVLQTDGRFPAEGARRQQHFVQLYRRQAEALAIQAEYGGQLAFVSRTGLEAYQSTIDLHATVGTYEAKAAYPASPLGGALKTAAHLINSNLATGVCYVTTGGFDTHSTQTGVHDGLLAGVSNALLAFYDDLQARGVADRVTTLLWSEFGRRVKENGSRGTDHGTAGPMFIVGGGVRPGLHGEQPSITGLDAGGDLKFTTDFRSVYASVIAQRFNMEPKDILGASYPTLPLFA
ncbi:MAG: DUF1501 domain-containing protein [Chloroflexi bacterium]|nr:DUF1501 domain-containing protein [Chloroflexota bacterium]